MCRGTQAKIFAQLFQHYKKWGFGPCRWSQWLWVKWGPFAWFCQFVKFELSSDCVSSSLSCDSKGDHRSGTSMINQMLALLLVLSISTLQPVKGVLDRWGLCWPIMSKKTSWIGICGNEFHWATELLDTMNFTGHRIAGQNVLKNIKTSFSDPGEDLCVLHGSYLSKIYIPNVSSIKDTTLSDSCSQHRCILEIQWVWWPFAFTPNVLSA